MASTGYSTLAPECDTDTEQRETEATSDDDSRNDNSGSDDSDGNTSGDGDSGDDDGPNSWNQCHLRYMAVIRVSWLNRRSRRDEWGFHCTGCGDRLYDQVIREFIMSTFREHLKECGPIKDGVHHINDCCNKGTCKKKIVGITPDTLPFWRY